MNADTINSCLDKQKVVYIHHRMLLSYNIIICIQMETVILSEISQSQKEKYGMFSLQCVR